MRRKIAGLPLVARMMLGLMTVALFAFIGMTIRETRPIAGYVFLGLAGFRLLIWIRDVAQNMSAPQEPLE